MGNCLFKLQKYHEALPFLELSVSLRKQYNTLMDGLLKYEQKLKECIKYKTSDESKIQEEKMQIDKQPSGSSSTSTMTGTKNKFNDALGADSLSPSATKRAETKP